MRTAVKTLCLHLSFLLLSSILSSCHFQKLSVQTQYFHPSHLASFHVLTPDSSHENAFVGQNLFIQWHVPNDEFDESPILLNIQVRFKKCQEKLYQFRITPQNGKFNTGYYCFRVVGKDYIEWGDIVTYRISIENGMRVLAEWKHPLWSNTLIID